MTFAIKLPKESIVSVQTLVAWINAHLAPSIPVYQTILHSNYIEEIYQQFASEVDRFLSFDRYKADSFKSKQISDVPEAEYRAWLQSQELELHITPQLPGVVNISVMLFGPDIFAKDGIGVGHEKIYNFYYYAYFDNEEYCLGLLPKTQQDISKVVPETCVPLNFLPVFEYVYTASKDLTKTYEEISKEIFDTLISYLEKEKGSEGVELASPYLFHIENFFKNAWEFNGSFNQPLYAQAFANSLPTAEGQNVFITLTTSYGKLYRCVLPILKLK